MGSSIGERGYSQFKREEIEPVSHPVSRRPPGCCFHWEPGTLGKQCNISCSLTLSAHFHSPLFSWLLVISIHHGKDRSQNWFCAKLKWLVQSGSQADGVNLDHLWLLIKKMSHLKITGMKSILSIYLTLLPSIYKRQTLFKKKTCIWHSNGQLIH